MKTSTSQSARILIVLLLCGAACSIVSGTLLAFSHSQTTAKVSHPAAAGLTFADRVAYQRAIEDIYWRHRIWPKANAGPKPPLDKVMSQAQIEKKVEDYLRNSQALEDYWQRLITPDQLQAEMERIASHTKQPGVLREIFAALGNDPFVIAECLARPVLAERVVTDLYAHDQRFHGELKRRAEAELRTHPSVRQMKQTSGMYTEMELIKSDEEVGGSASPEDDGKTNRQRHSVEHGITLNSREWNENVQKLERDFGNSKEGDPLAQIKTGVLSPLQEDDAHYYAVAVMNKGKDRLKLATIAWLKEPLRSWLAKAEAQMPRTMAAVSANYTLPAIASPSDTSSPSVACTDDTWTITTTNVPPGARSGHTAVWTGSEVIVWGGVKLSDVGLNTGGRYNPTTDTWTATSTTNAPTERKYHTAVWTGSAMIVWGGEDNNGFYLNTGGRYNPSTDTWTATSTTNAPSEREYHTAVWTGSEMIIWGGYIYSFPYNANTGGRYDPSTNSWTATSTTNAPTGRGRHTAVWTGSQMIVWGNGNIDITGGRYSPATNSWTATTTTNAPTARTGHTAVWTGSEMIVWGGQNYGTRLSTGARYNPSTDAWIATSATGAPDGRQYHTAVWTGSQMIVWGGDAGTPVFNTGGRYNPSTDSWTATSTTNSPDARHYHTAVWTGSQMIVWGGDQGDPAHPGYHLNTGGRYNPSTDSWIATAYAPAARGRHTAVWTGSEMIVWGGEDQDSVPLNTGGRYNPSTDSWTATSTTGAPGARRGHTAVWTGTQMIVWGNGNGGGRYNPGTDSWTATSTTNEPASRDGYTAVWTGSEMIVWGGDDRGTIFNTGGRYNPSTDSWIATSTTNAPAARTSHTAVWTGSQMIVWGGSDGHGSWFNTGGRYNPGTDSWTPTSLTSAPDARNDHTAVWTGSQMIVWGGNNGSGILNSGGRYTPSTDSWIATAYAPAARRDHTAVWTGSQMIVWGGDNGIGLNTGGRYNPATDSWTATSTTNAPGVRSGNSTVWTGNEMIVWGGSTSSGDFDTGGRYCAQSGPPPHPAFFTGEIALGGGWYYLQFANGTPFGYYSYLPDQNFIYHIDLGFEYLIDANDANHGIYFYDFASSSFFYTSPSTFPYLYDFSLNAWLYYLPDFNNPGRYTHNPRWFYNFATGQWITL